MNNIEKQIRKYCIKKKIKISHFLVLIEKSKPTVYNWFNGKFFPCAKNLKRLSKILNIPIEKII